jgi:hypothetical protein
MDVKKLFVKNRPVFVIGFLYTVTALIVVISAWIAGIRRFDLDLTISRYIGTRQWTTVFYLIVATVIATLGIIHLIKSGMGIVKKILNLLAFAFVWGCAVCPFNREWSNFISNLHQYFAYGLMLAVTLSFVWMAIRPANKEQRVFSTVAISYAALFIILFAVVKWGFFTDTIFLWENTFIYFLLAELIVEYKESRALGIFAKKFPVVGGIGMGAGWILCVLTSLSCDSIEDHTPFYSGVMNISVILFMISFIIFALSLITYVLYKPLSENKKGLDIILRVILTPMAMLIVLVTGYFTLFICSGAAY